MQKSSPQKRLTGVTKNRKNWSAQCNLCKGKSNCLYLGTYDEQRKAEIVSCKHRWFVHKIKPEDEYIDRLAEADPVRMKHKMPTGKTGIPHVTENTYGFKTACGKCKKGLGTFNSPEEAQRTYWWHCYDIHKLIPPNLDMFNLPKPKPRNGTGGRPNTSGTVGVGYDKSKDCFRAACQRGDCRPRKHIGCFKTHEAATLAIKRHRRDVHHEHETIWGT